MILARLAHDLVIKHPTGGHDSKQQGHTNGDEKLAILRMRARESEGSTVMAM
jgi:hypothetical protein